MCAQTQVTKNLGGGRGAGEGGGEEESGAGERKGIGWMGEVEEEGAVVGWRREPKH